MLDIKQGLIMEIGVEAERHGSLSVVLSENLLKIIGIIFFNFL
ncbi:hypothetical protein SPONN_988 [uncultured Candidatus Thioglobus sp.]|nr:hypothetical protein SPONN_988 [uncultured Candidatus Thioglobus sp.]